MKNILKHVSLLTKRKKKRLLALEANGFGLKAMIITKKGESLRVEGTAETRSVVARQALEQVMSQLKQAGLSLPKEAVLVCAGAVPALLKLPVPQGKKIAPGQIEELVRWEMDELTQDLALPPNIGWVMIARGHIDAIQRDQILDTLDKQESYAGRHGGTLPARFGEIAIEKGFIDREQLEDCLAIQERLHLLEDSLNCGWSDSTTTAGSQPGLTLCCAIHETIGREWLQALRNSEIRLERIYPEALTSAALLPLSPAAQCLVEIEQGHITVSSIEQGEITQSAYRRTCNISVSEEDLAELCRPVLTADMEAMVITGSHPNKEYLGTALAQRMNRKVLPLSLNGEFDCTLLSQKESWYALLGSSRHYLGMSSHLLAPFLPGEPPLPAMHKRPMAWLNIATACLLVFIGFYEISHSRSMGKIMAETETLQGEVRTIARANEKMSNKSAEYQKLVAKRDAMEDKNTSLKHRKDAVERVFMHRQQVMTGFLEAITGSIPDGVVLESIDEQEWFLFHIKGWALEQRHIDMFHQSLSRNIAEWNLYISESPSAAGRGWKDAEGYEFSFILMERKS
ncbi:MAG: hypothetical protein ISR96_02145 [Nitrospira sp.]|nr:hypothetical protein [bacterium]MBL7048318.1 hypothetical protein [Nitrospira sp.]